MLFRSTPPREGRRSAVRRAAKAYRKFRSTPPREGRPVRKRKASVGITFRSTPPREGRPPSTNQLYSRYSFDPRPRVRGDRNTATRLSMCSSFRSTPPREGRPRKNLTVRLVEKFRSTPPREGRPLTAWLMSSMVSFDPRPRVRGDGYSFPHVHHTTSVSIHAPA